MADSTPLRILHALAPGAVGGIESVVRLLAVGQQEAGHQVDVVTVVDEEGHPFIEMLERHGIRVHPIIAPNRAYRKELAAFRECLAKTNPQIVHTHGTRPDVLLSPAARKLGCATVTTVHGFSGGAWKNRVYETLQRRAMRSIGAVVAVSSAQQPILEKAGVPANRIHVLPNAWHPLAEPLDREAARSELGLPPSEKVIGYVGRLSFEKGPDLLVDALSKVLDLPWQASFLGDGNEATSLAEQSQRLGLTDRIRWHGNVSDASRLFRAFDLVVMPSRTEGTPISLFEAMHARVPLVLARVGGVPAVVEPAPDEAPMARLVPPLDVDALALAIREVLAGNSETHHQVEAAFQRLRSTYSVPPWLESYSSIYRGLLRSDR